ncbi:MAG: terminase family protein [Pseudomonadota bacterium]
MLKRLLNEIDPEVAAFIGRDWLTWARDDQLPPLTELDASAASWRTWLLMGGRGAGKTRAGAEWIRAKALGEAPIGVIPARRIALIGQTIGDVRSVMIEGVSGLLAIHTDVERPKFEPSKRLLTWPNGAVAQIFSADEPDSLRGPQFDAAWCDELCKFRHADATWDMLQFALRLGQAPQVVVTTTPRTTPLLKTLLGDAGTVLSHARTDDNAAHLSDAFLQTVRARYDGSWLGRQELDGALLEDREDALWQRDWFDAHRVRAAPTLQRIVVAVDPPVTSGANADACGIVVAGLGPDDRAYVLDDRTCKGVRPLEWAKAAMDAYHAYDADAVVAEVNQGGELVTTVMAQTDRTVPVRAVRATRGKWVRAEPVATLYAQGRVAHLGALPELEDQLCDFGRDGLSGGRSPDRVDALVWCLSDLMLTPTHVPKISSL